MDHVSLPFKRSGIEGPELKLPNIIVVVVVEFSWN